MFGLAASFFEDTVAYLLDVAVPACGPICAVLCFAGVIVAAFLLERRQRKRGAEAAEAWADFAGQHGLELITSRYGLPRMHGDYRGFPLAVWVWHVAQGVDAHQHFTFVELTLPNAAGPHLHLRSRGSMPGTTQGWDSSPLGQPMELPASLPPRATEFQARSLSPDAVAPWLPHLLTARAVDALARANDLYVQSIRDVVPAGSQGYFTVEIAGEKVTLEAVLAIRDVDVLAACLDAVHAIATGVVSRSPGGS